MKKPGKTFFQTYPSFGLVRSVASSRPGFRQTNPSPSANPDPARRITARAAQTSAAALGPAPHPAPLVGALGEEPGGRLRIEYSQFSADRPTEGKGGRLRWPAGRIAAPRENRLNKKPFSARGVIRPNARRTPGLRPGPPRDPSFVVRFLLRSAGAHGVRRFPVSGRQPSGGSRVRRAEGPP